MLTQQIDDIRSLIGRLVYFYTPVPSGCSTCSYDPVAETSTDSYCPECDGEYWVNTYTITAVSGHINWGPADRLNWQTAGKIFDGDCTVQIKAEDTTITLLDGAEYLMVDGRKMEEKDRTPRGVPDINRYILNCIEKEKI